MWKMNCSSTEDGGGVPGRGNGIVLDTMTEVGGITGEPRIFIDIFTEDGEMISGSIDGEANRGNIVGYSMEISIVTGATGKEQDTGTDLLPRVHLVPLCTDRGRVIRHLPHCADTVIAPVIGLIPEYVVGNPLRRNPVETVIGAGPVMTDAVDNPVFIRQAMKGNKKNTG